ncbi:MAG: hypothetical protein ACI4PF_02680 [Christensenellales bacterium]
MKKSNNTNRLSFDEYKNIIDELIKSKKIDKLKLQENYFDICNNYWIVDKYIATDGVIDETLTPNTFSAYAQTIENNYAISIPVQMLDDKNLVCFSHQNISKIIPSTSGYLKKLSLPEVKELNLNEQGEKIPTLDEALDFIANRTPIIIEIINDGMVEKFEDKVITAIQKYILKYDCYENVAVMSMNPYTLEYFFEHYPYITRILKSGSFKDKMYGSFKTRKLKKLKYYKITHSDFIAYSNELLPCSTVEKHKPVGIIAHSITNQNQYISIAEHCDNILFKNFKPTI